MCLQARLCPNTLGRLETVCEGPDTGVPPFSTAWEVCLSLQSEGERGRWGCCSRAQCRPPFVRGNTELEDTTVRPVTGPVSRESVVFHCKVSAVTFWLRGSCEEGGKCTDFNIWKTFTHLFVANIMNNVSCPIIFDCTPDPYCRCCSRLASLCDSQSTCAPDCA